MINVLRYHVLIWTAMVCLAWGGSESVRLRAAESTAGGISVNVAHPIHPLLIRNTHGPMLRINVDVSGKSDVKLQALTFKVEGEELAQDVDSLSLFATGSKDTFSPAQPVGEPVSAAATVVFRSEYQLRPGKNVFWLACRLKNSANLSHRVGAVCSLIETSAGQITPSDDKAGHQQRIGVALRKHQDDGVHTYRIPALTQSSKGTLLCVYDIRRRASRDLQEDIDIGLSRSTDGGQTWEPVRVIMDMGEYGGLPQELNGCSDPGIIVDQKTGEILCFAVWMNGKPGQHQWRANGSEPGYEIGKTAQLLVVRSKDDGLTWSKPENLTRTLKQEKWWLLAPAPQQGINLPDGTLVMPMQGRDEKGTPFATIMISSDHGTTWTVSPAAYSGGNECQAAQLGDGSIMLNIRNGGEHVRAVFVTSDLGQTWKPHPTNRRTLIEPTCNASLLRFDYASAGERKHLLLFANPHPKKSRTQHTIQVSFDDGLTWPEKHHILLDEGQGAGYPSLARVDDQHVGIVYEGSQSQLMFEKLSLAELLGQ